MVNKNKSSIEFFFCFILEEDDEDEEEEPDEEEPEQDEVSLHLSDELNLIKNPTHLYRIPLCLLNR